MKAEKQQQDGSYKSGKQNPFIQRMGALGPEPETTPFISLKRISTIQPKLTIGQPNDKYEREADQMADRVIRMPISNVTRSITNRPQAIQPKVQRTCAGCEDENQRIPIDSSLQEEDTPQSYQLIAQRKADAETSPQHAKPEIANSLSRRRGRGDPLPQSTKAHMESAFGADFSGVRVHRDSEAIQMSQQLNAQAFAHGSDVYFNNGKFAPDSANGTRLLAHELTHVVQQNGKQLNAQTVQRQICPVRENTENSDSRSAGGILEQNIVFNPSRNYLIVQDFGINRAALPLGVTSSADWRQAMSYFIGDPSVRIALSGYSDCSGNAQENHQLRAERVESVMAALPAEVQSKVVFALPIGTSNYLTLNDSPTSRARNRSVKIYLRQTEEQNSRGEILSPCDRLANGVGNMDEFLFLLRCAESRLNTGPATVLSAIRQIYYGNASWTIVRGSLFDELISVRPYAASNDLPGRLGIQLFRGLRNSKVVDGVDLGHVFATMDAMMHPNYFRHSLMDYAIGNNVESVSWAGDVGSAAARYFVETLTVSTRRHDVFEFYDRYVGTEDLLGNIDAFALMFGLNQGDPNVFALRLGLGGVTHNSIHPPLQLSRALSSEFMNFYRSNLSSPIVERRSREKLFIEMYGGRYIGNYLTNPQEVQSTLRDPIMHFSLAFTYHLLSELTSVPYTVTPDSVMQQVPTILNPAVDKVTAKFTTSLTR